MEVEEVLSTSKTDLEKNAFMCRKILGVDLEAKQVSKFLKELEPILPFTEPGLRHLKRVQRANRVNPKIGNELDDKNNIRVEGKCSRSTLNDKEENIKNKQIDVQQSKAKKSSSSVYLTILLGSSDFVEALLEDDSVNTKKEENYDTKFVPDEIIEDSSHQGKLFTDIKMSEIKDVKSKSEIMKNIIKHFNLQIREVPEAVLPFKSDCKLKRSDLDSLNEVWPVNYNVLIADEAFEKSRFVEEWDWKAMGESLDKVVNSYRCEKRSLGNSYGGGLIVNSYNAKNSSEVKVLLTKAEAIQIVEGTSNPNIRQQLDFLQKQMEEQETLDGFNVRVSPLNHSCMLLIEGFSQILSYSNVNSKYAICDNQSLNPSNSRISSDIEKLLSEKGKLLEKEQYLLTNLDVYLDAEPCLMCAMALVHSRIRRLIYNRVQTSIVDGSSDQKDSIDEDVKYNVNSSQSVIEKENRTRVSNPCTINFGHKINNLYSIHDLNNNLNHHYRVFVSK